MSEINIKTELVFVDNKDNTLKPDNRVSKDMYYLNIAKEVASRGTCLRRNYGAVIVKNDEIVSTGYTGAPRGRVNCNRLGHCVRIANKIPSGQRYEMCRSVHAEMNAIISAPRERMIGATLYLYGWDVEHNCEKKDPVPCTLCERMIINAGIEKVVTLNPDFNGEYYEPLTKEYKVSDYIENDTGLGTLDNSKSKFNDDPFLREKEIEFGIFLRSRIDDASVSSIIASGVTDFISFVRNDKLEYYLIDYVDPNGKWAQTRNC